MTHTCDFLIKIDNGIYILNQQELLHKLVYKLYDLVKVGRRPPPINGHGPKPSLKYEDKKNQKLLVSFNFDIL